MISQISISNTKRTLVRPQSLSKSVWIDASDYPVGTLADGTVLTNKAGGSIVIEVEGSTLAVQLNEYNKKEFVFDGTSYLKSSSGVSHFTKYKNGSQAYTVLFIGKVGAVANPDAFYGICGNNAGTSVNHGMFACVDNRVSTASNLRGYQHCVTRGTASVFPILSRYNSAGVQFNTRRSVYFTLDINIIDPSRLYLNSRLEGVSDFVRTTANTTSGLGSTASYSGIEPTYTFEIGTVGNGVFPLVGTMEQFILFDTSLEINQIIGIDEYFQMNADPTGSVFQRVSTTQNITSNYVLGGAYDKNAGKTKTVFNATRGPDHFAVGSDRDGVQLSSINNITTFPTSYTSVFSDGAGGNAVHAPYGGTTPTGRLVRVYGRYDAATATYNALISRYSDDDGVTWSAESALTIPTTSPALTAYIPHDKLVVCNNGDIALPMYALSGTSLYKIYVIRSSDNGVTWSFTEVYSSPTAYINECTLGHLGGNDWILMARIEAAAGGFFEYAQFYSDDDLLTFTRQTDTDFNLNYVYAHPPMLRPISVDGTPVMEFSWYNRGSRRLHFKYALPADLIANGGAEWNGKTLYTADLRNITGGNATGWRSGYPFIIHPNNDLKWEGVVYEENSTTQTTAYFVKLADNIKSRIKSDLAI